MALTSQIQGGIMMGLGYALWEGLLFEEGKIANASFADYKIPTARDIPTAIPIIVEKNYAAEPYGAKGVGEMAVFGIAPAIANAVARAVGVRIKDLPMSAEKLLEQIKKKPGREGSTHARRCRRATGRSPTPADTGNIHKTRNPRESIYARPVEHASGTRYSSHHIVGMSSHGVTGGRANRSRAHRRSEERRQSCVLELHAHR